MSLQFYIYVVLYLYQGEGIYLKIIDYYTDGGKNVIKEYLSSLPKKECHEGYQIRHRVWNEGLLALEILDTRQLKGKLWEIKFSDNRIMYVLKDKDAIYFLHACKKQKNKAEKHDLETALNRAYEYGLNID
jgi:phage-related protein